MPPKKQQTNNSKRKSKEIEDKNHSPNTIKPAKIQATSTNIKVKSNIMSEDAINKIFAMLEQQKVDFAEVKNQNTNIQLQMNQQKEHLDALHQQINESNITLKKQIDQVSDNIKTELKKDLDAINIKIDSSNEALTQKVNGMNDSMSNLKSRIIQVENDFDRISHLNELKLIGIPIKEGENLAEIFKQISAIIGFDSSTNTNIPLMSRLYSKNKNTGDSTPSSTILMKFVAVHLKESFYGLYLKNLPQKKISAKDLGFSSENRIIIGENLSRYNRDVFNLASTYKRDNKLASVFTVNGIVKVKLQRGSTAYAVHSSQQLEQLMSNTTSTAKNGQGNNVNTDGKQSNSSQLPNATAATSSNAIQIDMQTENQQENQQNNIENTNTK